MEDSATYQLTGRVKRMCSAAHYPYNEWEVDHYLLVPKSTWDERNCQVHRTDIIERMPISWLSFITVCICHHIHTKHLHQE